VVVPTLNEEKLLADTLSVFDRAWRERVGGEIVVSDGGSTDRTLEIAHAMADRVVVHTGPDRQTIAAGRNAGANVAGGEVIVFINGDTVPADLARFTDCLLEFTDRRGRYARASALACPVHFRPEDERLADKAFHGFYNGYVHLLSVLRIGAGRGECQVVRREMFHRVGGYRSELVAGEDFDLLARIGVRGRVRFAPELLVFESPRRFRKFGYFRVLLSWTLNALSVMFRGRSASDEWEPVR
jgi:glycosyltransferase involved in cell wall biosynthesis